MISLLDKKENINLAEIKPFIGVSDKMQKEYLSKYEVVDGESESTDESKEESKDEDKKEESTDEETKDEGPTFPIYKENLGFVKNWHCEGA